MIRGTGLGRKKKGRRTGNGAVMDGGIEAGKKKIEEIMEGKEKGGSE